MSINSLISATKSRRHKFQFNIQFESLFTFVALRLCGTIFNFLVLKELLE